MLNKELELEYDEELLNLFYICFNQHIPVGVMRFWQLLESNVSLVPVGMEGVGFRDSKNSTLQLFKRLGYDPLVIAPWVEEYESKLIDEHYERKEGK